MKTPTLALWPLLFGLIPSVKASFAPQVQVDNRTLDELYEAAKRERGILQVFSGGDAGSQGDAVRAAWKQRFPDIPLNLTIELSKYIDNRIDRAHLQNLHVADVVAMQTLHDFPRWKLEGKLLSYKPPTFDDLLETEKDFDGAYLPIEILSFGSFVYDRTKINASDVPTSYASLPLPQYRGRLILTYPNDDDAIAYLFSLIVSRYGYPWLYALATNDVRFVRGTGTPSLQLLAQQHSANPSSSRRALSITTYANGSTQVLRPPAPPEQYMSWAQTAGIIAGTPRPATARLFMAWLTSAAFQRANAATPSTPTVLKSVNAERGTDPYASGATQITGFRVFEQDRARVEWWKNLFEEVLGTPQGRGPIQVYPNPPFQG